MRVATWMLACLGAVALTLSGCTVTVTPEDQEPPAPTTITVRIVNNTSKPLDPQLYIAPVAGGVENLFAPANKRIGFGLGNLGIMEPLSTAELSIPCGQLGFVGTQGGLFGDDLTNPDGSGRQAILQEDVTVACGDTVTFRFTTEGGRLLTEWGVGGLAAEE